VHNQARFNAEAKTKSDRRKKGTTHAVLRIEDRVQEK